MQSSLSHLCDKEPFLPSQNNNAILSCKRWAYLLPRATRYSFSLFKNLLIDWFPTNMQFTISMFSWRQVIFFNTNQKQTILKIKGGTGQLKNRLNGCTIGKLPLAFLFLRLFFWHFAIVIVYSRCRQETYSSVQERGTTCSTDPQPESNRIYTS